MVMWKQSRAKVHDWDPEGLWFKPRCGHDKISAAVGPLNKALICEDRGDPKPCAMAGRVLYDLVCFGL